MDRITNSHIEHYENMLNKACNLPTKSWIGGKAQIGNIHVQGIDTEVVDTCGAGDSFIAMLSTQDWSHDVEKVLYKCNLWAGLSTETKGATPPSFDLFKERYEER